MVALSPPVPIQPLTSGGSLFYSGRDVAAQIRPFDGRGKEEIYTDADKVKIAVRCYADAIKWRTDWIGIAGIIITVFISLSSGISRGFWYLSVGQVTSVLYFILGVSILSLLYIIF